MSTSASNIKPNIFKIGNNLKLLGLSPQVLSDVRLLAGGGLPCFAFFTWDWEKKKLTFPKPHLKR